MTQVRADTPTSVDENFRSIEQATRRHFLRRVRRMTALAITLWSLAMAMSWQITHSVISADLVLLATGERQNMAVLREILAGVDDIRFFVRPGHPAAQALEFREANHPPQEVVTSTGEQLVSVEPIALLREIDNLRATRGRESAKGLIPEVRAGSVRHAWEREVPITNAGAHLFMWLIGDLLIIGFSFRYVALELAARERLDGVQRALMEQTTFDSLTGLYNRAPFLVHLGEQIALARRSARRVGVLVCDLDNLKVINDSMGHAAGDALIQQIAERLTYTLRGGDVLSRQGGDEFFAGVVCVHTEELSALAGRIHNALGDPILVGGQSIGASMSIGIAVFPDDGDSVSDLIKKADTALHRGKEGGKHQTTFFTEDMNERALQRMTLETGMRAALCGPQFWVSYQPQCDIATGRIIGMEALLRWEHPELGPMAPGTFIPIAEKTDLIIQIGEWVIEHVARQMYDWRKTGLAVPRVSINVSAAHFRAQGFVEKLVATLEGFGCSPGGVCIELTESALVHDLDAVSAVLLALRQKGFHISLDDFGTGYSSLSYLKRLPLDEIKLDKAFVDGLATNPNDLAIARAIIAMARTLKLRVVAEGVETARQLELLMHEGCDIAQGFFLHRPIHPTLIVPLLQGA